MGSCMNKQDAKQQNQPAEKVETTQPKPTKNSTVNIVLSNNRQTDYHNPPVKQSSNNQTVSLPPFLVQQMATEQKINPRIIYTNSYYKEENGQSLQGTMNQGALKTSMDRQAELLRLSDPVQVPRLSSNVISEPNKSLEYFEQRSKQSILIRQFGPRT